MIIPWLFLFNSQNWILQNGNRVADVEGSEEDVQRAIEAIKERFSGGRGDFRGRDEGRAQSNQHQDSRSYNRDRSQNNYSRQHGNSQSSFPRNAQQSNADDNEWENASKVTPQRQTYQSSNYQSSNSNNNWEETSYQPSANTYQRSGSGSASFGEQPKRYDRGSSSSYGGDRRRGNFDGGYQQNDSRSSYSRDNKSSYRSNEDPPPTSHASNQPEPEFTPIDWAKANKDADEARKERWSKCPLMVKDFYVEHPEVTNMSDEDVEAFRKENKNIVVSRTFADEASTEPMPKPTTKFEHAFEKFPDLMAEITKAGFEKPSPIQSQMWPILLRGEDCIGIAQTGTGKTLAFLLPALIHTDGQPHPRGVAARGGPNVLVLAPTRELAIQIEKEVAKYQFRGIKA